MVTRCIAIAIALIPALASAQEDRPPLRVRARQETILSWAPRYRLGVSASPIGLEQQMWQRVESLPLYHRASLDATGMADGILALHFAGWGAIDLFVDSDGGLAAGDVAIAYAELELAPVSLWGGRRFVTYGPPGGLHVDGGGASVRAPFGLVAEVFAGRPVTPERVLLLGPTPSFDGAAAAYGARVAYSDPGTIGAAASFAELWSHGIVSSRTVDLAAHWSPADLRLEAGAKIDARDPGFAQARVGASYRFAPEVAIDADFLHVEPRRWIPAWSILSVFETSTFDELSLGATVRPLRALAIRVELAGRSASGSLGYRADAGLRVLDRRGVRLRVLASRRDDGVIGYTLAQIGVAFDPIAGVVVALEGSFAIDDDAERDALIGSASADWDPAPSWRVGVTASIARTPIAEAEARAMLRVRWTPEVP